MDSLPVPDGGIEKHQDEHGSMFDPGNGRNEDVKSVPRLKEKAEVIQEQEGVGKIKGWKWNQAEKGKEPEGVPWELRGTQVEERGNEDH